MAISLDKAARHLASNLILLRKKKHLSQQQLAILANMTRAAIAQFESGTSNPTLELLLKLSLALQISVEELISSPRLECQLLKASEIPLDRRSKNGITLRKLLPDKIPASEFDELVLEVGSQLAGTPHIEGTREYFSCLKGKFSLTISGMTYELERGDVLSFPGDRQHFYKNIGNSTAQGISAVFFAG